MADMIPPAVIDIIGRDSDLLATLARDEAALKAFANTETDPKIGADSGDFQTTLTGVKTELLDLARELTKARLGADADPFWAEIAQLRAQVAAISPLDINVELEMGSALAQMAALRGALALASTDQLIPGGGGGGGGGGGFLSTLLASFLGDKAAGGGGGGGGILSALGFGGSGGIAAGIPILGTLLGGMAGFPSLGELAGFGPETIAGAGIGIGGSLIGAGIGGGLLGAGAAGVAGVGMGTDMAGIGQAISDVQKYQQALTNLNQTVAQFGAGSTQAAGAQNLLNSTLAGMPAAAQGAIVALSNTLGQFKTLFDQATGIAEAKGAALLGQIVQVGEKFLPTIGQFASENMTIITKALQPLFNWLSGPGLAIFTNLEQIFQQNLPAAMNAFVQGVELVIKIIDVAAQHTGGFIQWLSRLFTKLNGPDWGKVKGEVNNLISLFMTWFGLFVSIGKVLFDIFEPSVGLGKAFASSLTGVFNQIGGWLKTMGPALHSLFSADLGRWVQIIFGAIQDILPVLEAFIGAWIRIADILRPIVNAILGPLVKLLGDLFKIPLVAQIAGWILAIFLLARALATVGLALAANPVGIWITAIALLIVGIYELATHWHQVTTDIKNWFMDAVNFVKSHANLIALAVAAIIPGLGILIAAMLEIAVHWKAIWGTIISIVDGAKSALQPIIAAIVGVVTIAWAVISAITVATWNIVVGIVRVTIAIIEGVIKVGMALITGNWSAAWNALKGMFSSIWSAISGAVTGAISALVGGVEAAWHGLVTSIQSIWGTAVTWFNTIKGSVTGVFKDAIHWLEQAGKDIVQGLINGITGMVGALGKAIGDVASKAKSFFTNPLGIFSPSTVFMGYGQNIVQGLAQGIQGTSPTATNAISHLAAQIKGTRFGSPGLYGTTGPAGAGAAYSPTYHVTINAAGGNSQQISTAMKQVLQQHDDELIRRLAAGRLSSA